MDILLARAFRENIFPVAGFGNKFPNDFENQNDFAWISQQKEAHGKQLLVFS